MSSCYDFRDGRGYYSKGINEFGREKREDKSDKISEKVGKKKSANLMELNLVQVRSTLR